MATEIEIWKDIEGFENYMISSLGNGKRKESLFVSTNGRIRKLQERSIKGTFNKGYHYFGLQKIGDNRKYQVQRLVAKAFIPNPENKPFVNHKNGNPLDNRVENLEWCTPKENSVHSRFVLGKDTANNRKRVLCVNTGKEYKSAVEVTKEYKWAKSNVYNVLLGHSKQTKGLKFIYI